MQVDFSKEFKQFDGKVIQESPDKPDAFTLRTASINGLMFKGEQEKLSGEEQMKRFDLSTLIYASTEPLDIASEQIVLIKEQIAKIYTPIIVGQAWKMLEGQL